MHVTLKAVKASTCAYQPCCFYYYFFYFLFFFHDYCHVYNLYQVKISTFNTLTDVVGLLFDRGV